MKDRLLALFLIAPLFWGCSESTQPTEKQSGKEITAVYHQNQNFSFDLDLNADGGYQWDYIVSDTNVLRIDSTSYRPKSGRWDQVGGLTVETFHCCTKHLGTSMLKLKEHQAWLKDVSPIDSLLYVVIVNE